MNISNNAKQKPKWTVYCFFAAIILAVVAAGLYFSYRQSISSEFGHNEAYFGEAFEELYAMSDTDTDFVQPTIDKAYQALTNIGAGEEFGLLSRYCIDPSVYPEASQVEAELEMICVSKDGNEAYVWVAYHQSVYAEDGALVTASGTKDSRILSRWSLENVNGEWTISEIKEKP